MGFMDFMFGGKPKVTGGYSGDQRENMRNNIYGQMQNAMSKVSAPNQSAFGAGGAPGIQVGGKSSWGFANPAFTQKYNPFQFQMPNALDQKTGIFGQMLGNTNREILRNQRAAVDSATRAAKRAGVYSPEMMKNTVLNSQKAAQEAIGDFGTKTAFDTASEMAKYQNAMQQQQAAENQAAHSFGLKGGELGLAGEELAMKGNQLDQLLKMQDLGQQQNYFLDLLRNAQGSFVDPYVVKQGGGGGGLFGQLLGAGASLGGAFI